MADGGSREEKLAAGLKKFKQFQQRSGRKTMKNKSVLNSSPEKETETVKSTNEVPSTSPKCSNPPVQSKSMSSSSTQLNESASTEAGPELESRLSDSTHKSKSEQDLSAVKELSSTESLRQISQQVNGLMCETDAFLNGSSGQPVSSTEPENESLGRRNRELSDIVSGLRQSNDQLQFQLQEQRAKCKRLSQGFDREREELQERSHREQVSLKDQLQVHIQTIGILVAEKTELQSSLALAQQTAKQKAGEVEELQGRLRASRQRAADLERELITLSNSAQQNEKLKAESAKDIERLKLDNYKLSKTAEDLKIANVEMTEKLNKKISEAQCLEKELSEVRGELSAAEAKLSSSAPPPTNSDQLEAIHEEKLELEKRLSMHKESMAKLIQERDQMGEQYQQYIQQLSQQVTSLRDEVKQLSKEKEELSREGDTLREVLETQSTAKDVSTNLEESSELKLQTSVLTQINEDLKQNLQTELGKNSELAAALSERDQQVADLEKRLERLRESQVDQASLLETMQSDKVAASRAVAQNRELKKQLEELQSGFVEMSNDKLQLAERLHSEQHICRELGERLSQQEQELQELRDQLSERESEVQNLHHSNTKGLYQQNQIADRMRHYEAQGQLVEMLQKELHQAQEQIMELTNQNSELRMAIATQAEVTVSDECLREDRDVSKRNDLVASLSASVRQLEMERNQLMRQLEEQKSNRTNLEEQLKKRELLMHHQGVNGTSEAVSKEEYDLIKRAMTQLEDRFKQTMSKIAELSDERQQLEHLVMQLQGETDTIGDYIALYQIQRSLMRKRASEKDDYIAQLARDREDLKAKLGELQSLVMRLLEERKFFGKTLDGVDAPPHLDDLVNSMHHAGEEHPEDSFVQEMQNGPPQEDQRQATARKIVDLLTEIEATNLVEKPVPETFHPCPVCSGRLITV